MVNSNIHFHNEIKKIKNYFNVGKYDVVIQKSKILIKKNPEFIGLYNIIGISFHRQKRYEEAINIFHKGLKVDPISLDLTLNLANTYKTLNNFKLAEEYYKKNLDLNPNHFLSLLNYANLKNDLNMVEESISLYDQAIKVDSNNFSVHFNKAFLLQSIGNFKDSIYHGKKCLELNNSFTPADTLLSKMINYKENDWHLKSMLEKVNNNNLNLTIPNLYNLHFAISAAYEKLNEMSLSMKHTILANQLKRQSLKFNINNEIGLFNDIKSTFKNLDLKSLQLKDSKNKLIFILGLPRSGTTLVEQIISTHSNVFGAGELFTLANIIKDSFFDSKKSKNTLNEKSLINTNYSDWQKKYNDYLLVLKHNQEYLTDKNPLNFLWIGFIKIIFPNSIIIHCHRDPKENCLSIYKNNFPGTDLGWAYDQGELGNYYNLYNDLMKFWHELLPGSIYDIKYEELINNQEKVIKSLIEACGLKWEKNCLSFHQNTKPIKTLSVTQARKKIYKTSLDLSENYKLELKELFSKLS